MSIEHRAKQFLPFTALTELEVAIEEKNKNYYKKLENDHYKQKVNELKRIFRQLNNTKNIVLEVTFYDQDETVVTGEFKEFDPLNKTVTIANMKIPINSINEIRAT